MENSKRKELAFPMFGLVVLAAGILLLMKNLDVAIGFVIWDFWPVPVILLGLNILIKPANHMHAFSGAAVVATGVLFQLNNLDYIDFRFRHLWPVVIILVGFSIISSSFSRPKERSTSTGHGYCQRHILSGGNDNVSSSDVDLSVLLAGGEYRVTNKEFTGGRLSSILGGIELDMRDAVMAGREVILDCNVILGGIELRIPSDWEVVKEVEPILGGLDNKAASPEGSRKRIVLRGSIILGGIEVKN
ncbi:MAG: cell wall-active antibiotics response protein [bacterium]|nr:cell wall-active antibiotics response protein [bacterium]